MSFIRANGVEIPSPSKGMKFLGSQIVDSARNANGVVKSQKINRRQTKMDSLTWAYLDAHTWENIILPEIMKHDVEVEFYDPHFKSWIRMQCYWGDDTFEPLFYDKSTGKPISYVNCGCNIIDKGEPIVFI